MSLIKVIDTRSKSVSQDLIDSFKTTGFAVITNHGISKRLISDTLEEWKEFFNNPKEIKETYGQIDNGSGYYGYKSEIAIDGKYPDLKEFYHVDRHWLTKYNPTSTTDLFNKLDLVARKILNTLDPTETLSEECYNSNNTILRAIRYPAITQSDDLGVRASEHTDINYITLLVSATCSGLQVKDKEGNWHEVPQIDNSIVVNIGDMLQFRSNGAFKSTTHRVVNANTNIDRYSIPFFVHPRPNTLLTEGITAEEFLKERLDKILLK